MEEKLKEFLQICSPLIQDGKTATYIPELAGVNPDLFGIYVKLLSGEECSAGDSLCRFTIQSVSKIIMFLCALIDSDERSISKKVGMEPTSDGFNSIVNLETKNANRPLNPLINSGAITLITLIKGEGNGGVFRRVLDMARLLSGNPELDIQESVYMSEKETGSRNRALAYYLKSTNIISGDVEEILDNYFKICSISVNAKELANIAAVFANKGVLPDTGERVFSDSQARRVIATMALCGMYDESGRFAVEIGMPSKSGVGGGILSVVPGRMGIGVFGPALNEKGSSIAGIELLRLLSEEYGLSVY